MNLASWVGRAERVEDVVSPTHVAAMSATLDRVGPTPQAGEVLPPLWHWLFTFAIPAGRDLGPDGHARRGDFLPPVALPRRMWAGGRVVFRAPLRVGDRITRTSTIESVAEKVGRSGPLCLVTVRHELYVADEPQPAITELQDLVYRDAPRPGDSPPRHAAPRPSFIRVVAPDSVLLFRYSALTFNGHRIHYDRRYAMEVEGYPGLVVHGPLLATLLLDLLRDERPNARVASFEFRALRPIFDTHPFQVCGAPLDDSSKLRLWAMDHEGFLTMDATASLA